MYMKRTVIFCLSLLLLAVLAVSAISEERIQLSILLDTSGSMDGLIDQAKSQLWKIVNELALAKRNGQSPKLEVALYEYGNDGLSAREGYLRMIVPLTTDLDKISEELFKLTTNGGSEYCGEVIQKATQQLLWSKSNTDLKLIFIAGNEPFDQGQINYKQACKNAITKGIIVNTIHCGPWDTGVTSGWKDGADLADGQYLNIDQDQAIVYIKAPQDEEIERLGIELNQTYLAYGSKGEAYKERQAVQDKNAKSMNQEAAVQRSVSKAQSQYSNSEWDLVDGVTNGSVDLSKTKKEDLPKEMQNMNKEQQTAYINELTKKRQAIQTKINELNQARRGYVEQEQKKSATQNTLDTAIINIVRKQAVAKNYKFGN
jgi:hypothetical protein